MNISLGNTLKCTHHLPAQVRPGQAATVCLKTGWSKVSLCLLLGISNNSAPQIPILPVPPPPGRPCAAQYQTPKPFHRTLGSHTVLASGKTSSLDYPDAAMPSIYLLWRHVQWALEEPHYHTECVKPLNMAFFLRFIYS